MDFLTHLLVSKRRGDENSPKLGRSGGINFLRNCQSKTGRQRENTKFVGVVGFFHISLLTITYHCN